MKKHIVLVVDDQKINRDIMNKILSEEYELLFAENGKEAMDYLNNEEHNISAVILDLVMPVMDGYEVLVEMQKNSRLVTIPVIVSSQMDGDENEIKVLSLGAYDFIAKPYKPDIIKHRLKNSINFRESAATINRIEKDELTGVYNKHFFIKSVGELLENNPDKDYDLVCFGVERFKLINDLYGMETGDNVLKHIAKVALELSDKVGICGRFDADKFYFVMERNDNYELILFDQLEKKINQYELYSNMKINCGIYPIKDKENDVNTMCDRALLAAEKNRGLYDSNFSYYDDSIREKLVEEQHIINSMQSALDEKRFKVFYQPKYDINSEKIVGAEALVRWMDQEKGMISPQNFIPLFEKNGFIAKLDEYVWEVVCQNIRHWIDCGYPQVSISVNVSRIDLFNPNLCNILQGLVKKYNIPISLLHLEITESAYTDNQKQVIDVVANLRGMGFVIEMDDFGSGYSSLNMLAEMPVDVLKLDMRFIQNQSEQNSGTGILSFAISLAKWMDLAVIAEGVETIEQISSLRSMDCNYVQGYYYAKPMDAESFESLLLNSKTSHMICKSQVKAVRDTSLHEDTNQLREVLVVDDTEINRDVIREHLGFEHTVVEKSNGKDAIDYLSKNYKKIDIILLDLLMPIMDGFEALSIIRREEKYDNIPVIITSQNDNKNEKRAFEMGADDFIPKPYNSKEVISKVNRLIESRKYRQIITDRLTLSNGFVFQGESSIDDYIKFLEPFFDVVRIVRPKITEVHLGQEDCQQKSCYSVWGKNQRCNNCISLKALNEKCRYSKIEYCDDGVFFVVSQYIPYGDCFVIEMVSKLSDEYIEDSNKKDEK